MEILRELPCLATLSLEGFASGDSIRRRATELTMRMRLSGASDSELATIGAAADRLMDPVGRFEESLRWLVLPEGTVARVSANSGDWAQRLLGLRDAVAKHSSPECRSHNELVLVGLKALIDPTAQVGKAEFRRIASLSNEVAASDAFWTMVNREARAIGDPRLVGEAVWATRTDYQSRALVQALAPIQAELRRHVAAGAREALYAMVAAGVPERVLSALRSRLIGEVVQRCEHALAELEPRAEVTNSREVHEQVVRAVRERLDREASLLAELGEVGGESCNRIRDAYAELLRTLAIRGVNVHGMDADSAELVARARSIAAGSALRSRLDGDGKTLAENAAFRTCVYCKRAPADGEPVPHAMFRVTDRHLMSVSYQSLTVPVPRCKGCVARHRRSETFHLVGAFVGVVAGIAIAVSLEGGSRGRHSNPCVGIMAGAVLGGLAGFLLTRFVTFAGGMSDGGSALDFPPILKLLAEGWKFGAKPGKGD
jgi:hypothetical protein